MSPVSSVKDKDVTYIIFSKFFLHSLYNKQFISSTKKFLLVTQEDNVNILIIPLVKNKIKN